MREEHNLLHATLPPLFTLGFDELEPVVTYYSRGVRVKENEAGLPASPAAREHQSNNQINQIDSLRPRPNFRGGNTSGLSLRGVLYVFYYKSLIIS